MLVVLHKEALGRMALFHTVVAAMNETQTFDGVNHALLPLRKQSQEPPHLHAGPIVRNVCAIHLRQPRYTPDAESTLTLNNGQQRSEQSLLSHNRLLSLLSLLSLLTLLSLASLLCLFSLLLSVLSSSLSLSLIHI